MKDNTRWRHGELGALQAIMAALNTAMTIWLFTHCHPNVAAMTAGGAVISSLMAIRRFVLEALTKD